MSVVGCTRDALGVANPSADSTSLGARPLDATDSSGPRLTIVAGNEPRVGLMWLPALGVPAHHYLPMAQALAECGVAVALHEWRGTGTSTVRASRRCDWGYREVLELDLPESFAQMRARHGELPWIVGGHSIGGQFAALFAAMRPELVRGVAMVASGSPYWRTFPRRQQGLLRLAYALVKPITSVFGYFPGRRLGFGGNEARTLMRDWAHSGRTGRYAPPTIEADLETALGRFGGAVFAAQLADDALCPAASLDWLLAKMPQAIVERARFTADRFDNRRATHFSWMKAGAPIVTAIDAWRRRSIAD